MLHSMIRSILVCSTVIGVSCASAAGYIARAQFASDVLDREPIDELSKVIQVQYGEIQRVYFFTDIRDLSGSEVAHVWKLNGQEQATIPFDIGGDRWRVWSSKRLMPGLDGHWTVDIVKGDEVLESHSFDYVDEW